MSLMKYINKKEKLRTENLFNPSRDSGRALKPPT